MHIHDAHLHLEFFANPKSFARDAATIGLGVFANTVTPQGFESIRCMANEATNVCLGLGMHPWRVEDANVDKFDRLLPQTNWIGEVGLDFSPKRAHHERQLKVFEHIAHACATEGSKVLSIHSVRSAGVVLDVLERTGCIRECTCIFHWFSGSTEDLWRAIRSDCWFSVNEMQARTRRAKEQLKLIPNDRLLLETDLPPADDANTTVDEVVASLTRTQKLVEHIRNASLGDQLQQNWERLTNTAI